MEQTQTREWAGRLTTYPLGKGKLEPTERCSVKFCGEWGIFDIYYYNGDVDVVCDKHKHLEQDENIKIDMFKVQHRKTKEMYIAVCRTGEFEAFEKLLRKYALQNK